MKVSWDEAKNLANQKKHGISFDEAQNLFTSGDYLEIFDEEHSETEERFVAIGLIVRGLIVVVWTQRRTQFTLSVPASPRSARKNCTSRTWAKGYD